MRDRVPRACSPRAALRASLGFAHPFQLRIEILQNRLWFDFDCGHLNSLCTGYRALFWQLGYYLSVTYTGSCNFSLFSMPVAAPRWSPRKVFGNDQHGHLPFPRAPVGAMPHQQATTVVRLCHVIFGCYLARRLRNRIHTTDAITSSLRTPYGSRSRAPVPTTYIAQES